MKKQIISRFLIGSAHGALDFETPIPELADLISRAKRLDRESGLLVAASLLNLYEKAGTRPSTLLNPNLSKAKMEIKTKCNSQSGSFLGRILNGEHPELLDEWLTLLSSRGQRVPEEYLPRLFEVATKRKNLRDFVSPVSGERGLWLASMNPEWRWICGETETRQDWPALPNLQRKAFFKKLRISSPGEALEMLLSTWETESPEDKVEFIQSFTHGLNPSDESFLEKALKERRKEIRNTASFVLSKLQSSAFCTRNIERLKKIIFFNEPENRLLSFLGFPASGKFVLSLPDSFDPDLSKDGISPKMIVEESDFKGGEKAHIVFQMLIIPTPDVWVKLWNKPADQLIQAALQSEWKDLLMEGWTKAAIHHKEETWAKAIISEKGWISQHDRFLPSLFAIIRDKEKCALEFFSSNSTGKLQGTLFQILGTLDYQWNLEFSKKILEAIFDPSSKREGNFAHVLGRVALRLSPFCAVEAVSRLGKLGAENPEATNQKAFHNFMSVLQFRLEMHESFVRKQEQGEEK